MRPSRPVIALVSVAALTLASCGSGAPTAVPGVWPTTTALGSADASDDDDATGDPFTRSASDRDDRDDGAPTTNAGASSPPPSGEQRTVVPAVTTTAPVASTAPPPPSDPVRDTLSDEIRTGPPEADASVPPPTASGGGTTAGPEPERPSTAPAVVVDPIPPPGRPLGPPADPGWSASVAAFEAIARGNPGASMTVTRGGEIVVSRASGSAIDGSAATGDTPMVVASVTKLLVAMAVARLVALGSVSTDDTVPWGEIGVLPHGAWSDVTLRELLDHTSGMPVERSSWFVPDGDCTSAVQALVASPPRAHRGRWTYSNGNYCLLGLVVAARSGLPLADALRRLVFDPVDAHGAHLTDTGLLPGDMAHPNPAGVARLVRLGGAGTAVASTDDLALVFGRLTDIDRWTLRSPGVFTDQYGIGHTGTVDGAKACVWILEGGDTTVAATIAGDSLPTGGAVCDVVVPAVAADLGIAAGRPDRTP